MIPHAPRPSLFAFARHGAVAAVVAIAALGPVANAGGRADSPMVAPPASTASDRYIVKFRDTAAEPNARLAAIGTRNGKAFQYLRAMSGGAHVIRITRGAPTPGVDRTPEIARRLVAQQLMSDPDVLYIEPDAKVYPMRVPNDPQYSAQWNYYEAAGGINLPGAWDITTGSTGIVVAVLDTGIRPHVDLVGRTVPGYDFIGDTSVSNDGDGRDADPSDPGDYSSCNANSSWHGTHVSGTIGASSDNGVGVTGINWVSKILPARVLGACGGYTSDIVDAMRWSAGIAVAGVPTNANPARVENLSFGGSGPCGNAFQSAVNDVVARGTVVVVAAGNSDSDVSGTSPANCVGVIAVAATSRSGSRASYSNNGAGITIAAPGSIILSTLNSGSTTPGSDTYAYYSGTSMATPHVTGVVSLMLSQNPSMTPAQVKARLQATARAFPAGTGLDCTTAICGAGIVDARAALVAPPTSRVNIASQASGAVASGSSVYASGFEAARANDGEHRGVNWGAGGGWNDATNAAYPDWIRIDFPSAKSVSEIDVFTLQDDWQHPVEPTSSMTFSQYGITNFDVQYYDGSNWVTVPGGHVVGNNAVWNKITFAAVTTSSIRVLVSGAADGWVRITEVEAYNDAPSLNVARSANGGVASGSTTYAAGFAASGAIDGDRRGTGWGVSGGWNDATPNQYPDQLQINFDGTKSIGEIDVFTVQDNWQNPAEPTPTMTFTQYGIKAFDVQYWTGSNWVTVPNGSIDGNSNVWRKVTFSPVSTNAIRINVRGTADGWVRITEVEAYLAQ